jgi:hypothetical protein
VQVTESQDVRYARLLGAALNADQEVNGQRVPRYTRLSEAIAAWHPEKVYQKVHNPNEFAREAVSMLHWGGGELHAAMLGKSRETIISTTFNLAWADVTMKVLKASMDDPELGVWRQLVSDNIPFSNFTDAKKIIRIGDYGDIPTVNELAPYQELDSPTQEKVELSIVKKGSTVSYSWESALNDDLRVLASIPRKLGLSWARTVYKGVFALLTANSGDGAALDYDTTNLYHADHANNDDAAFTAAGLISAVGKMRAQTDIDEDFPKEYQPRFLLYARSEALRQSIWEALSSAFKVNPLSTSGSQVNLPNFIREVYGLEPVEVIYGNGSTTRCEIVANPQRAGTIAVGFLNGMETPEFFVQDMERVGSVFNNDVITMKVRGSFGATLLDHRSFSRIDK